MAGWLDGEDQHLSSRHILRQSFEFQGRRIHDLTPRDFNCISAGEPVQTLTHAIWDR